MYSFFFFWVEGAVLRVLDNRHPDLLQSYLCPNNSNLLHLPLPMDSEADDTKSHIEIEERYSQLEPQAKKSKKKKEKNKQPQPVEAKVQVLRDHHQKIPPIVGYFPSGFNPQKNTDGESEAGPDSTTVRVYRHRNMPKRLQLVVSPSGSPVDFVGTSYSGEAAAGQRCMYALGVFDKEKQSLRVVPIAANKVISEKIFFWKFVIYFCQLVVWEQNFLMGLCPLLLIRF